MSFFGFDPSQPPGKTHNAKAPGFGSAPDPFAGLSGDKLEGDDEDELDFEDTYDGLGENLDETHDDLNDATFGGSGPVSKDFDFSNQSAPTSSGQYPQPSTSYAQDRPTQYVEHSSSLKPASKPAKTGYERYDSRGVAIPHLEATPSIWQDGPTSQLRTQPQHGQQPSLSAATRKMMSLEEVEAAMRAQAQAKNSSQSSSPQPSQQQQRISQPSAAGTGHRSTQPFPTSQPPQILQRPVQPPVEQTRFETPHELNAHRDQYMTGPSMLQQDRSAPLPHTDLPYRMPPQGQAQYMQQESNQNFQQHTSRPSIPPPPHPSQPRTMRNGYHGRAQSIGGRIVNNPNELMQLPEEERAALLLEETNRAKRNHKILVLSRDNGLMTPQDKNFITRIQLQQLVTATGGVEEQGPEVNLAEDFYFQVFSQIRGAPRQEDNFAQTYLNELAWRGRNRRHPRGGENHMRRMEQQVQRAVEAAKARPKNKQLVVEGSLGKISFSNAKTPKLLLNIKRQENHDPYSASAGRAKAHETIAGRKAVLRDIEALYSTLMKMEDHERRMQPPPNEESSADEIQSHMEWRQRIQELNKRLWIELKVQVPIDSSSQSMHPFMAILSHAKGKKLVPRLFRQIDDQQRLIVLTMVVVHLDQMDVIRDAQPEPETDTLPNAVRDSVELFSNAVMPCLFAYTSDAPFEIVIGLVGLVTDRTHLPSVIRTRTGINILFMLISRAQMIKQAGNANDSDCQSWTSTFDALFSQLEPYLSSAFSAPASSGDDQYMWQFLAAMGIESSPEQQQRLVIAVKDKVMETVSHAKELPADTGKPQLDKVNLFMHAIGLDVDLLG